MSFFGHKEVGAINTTMGMWVSTGGEQGFNYLWRREFRLGYVGLRTLSISCWNIYFYHSEISLFPPRSRQFGNNNVNLVFLLLVYTFILWVLPLAWT